MRIILGAVISLPPHSPGTAWDRMQFATGLERLGHDVTFVEEVQPAWCRDSDGNPCGYEDSVNRSVFRDIMQRFGFADRCCQVYDGGEATSGLSLDALAAVSRDADLLLNISGHVRIDEVLGGVRRRAYLDQDPVYTQLWRAAYGKSLNFESHDVFLTVGLNIGTPHTPIPTGGVHWHHTLSPVVLDFWPVSPAPDAGRFTTIASWTGYDDLSYAGESYGAKGEEFERFASLPGKVDQEFEVALRRHEPGDPGVRLLQANGWTVTAATRITDMPAYQDYIARSRAEIGIAKNAYVKPRSGWFGDRTSHYLASGRPALVQASGFERTLPTGRGLLTFDTMEEAVESVERINRDYDDHCRAARELAEAVFDYRKILPRMLEDCTGTPG
jgi:hypothetical protein